MIDTNILLSALVFKSVKMADLLEYVAEKYTLVLCSYVIAEANTVITRKSSKYQAVLDYFLLKMSFEMAYTSSWQPNMPDIRDEKDKPILASAIVADVDVLITGDKDFYDVDIERPEILSPADFLEKY
jgi:putative PIN family toxin of toxin-antitoxin system